MAQIAIILPAPSQAAPPGPPAGGDESMFPLHLENAIASNHPPQKSPPKKTQSTEDQHGADNQSTGAEPKLGGTLTADGAEQAPRRVFAGQNGNSPRVFEQNSIQKAALQEIQADTSIEVMIKSSTLSPSQPTRFNPENEALLERLRQIINNSSEKGTVSVSRSVGSVSAETIVTGISQLAGEGLKASPELADQQLHSLRQNVQQQYYQAKVNSNATEEDGSTTQNTTQQSNTNSNNQSNDPAAQASLLAQHLRSTSLPADPPSNFSPNGPLMQEAPPTIFAETASPVMLPSGTVFLEENVVLQFMERFQLGRRLAESKINIKLHPAELGELKIDLTVKEGAIRANVVAQSQQVQEIIERNIARLRSLLEGQGFSLDSVTVTTESDSVGDFNLFDKQLFSQHDDFQSPPAIVKESGPALEPDNFYRDGYPGATGVNVRI